MINCLLCQYFTETESPFASTGFNKLKKALGSKSSLPEKHNASEVHKLAEEKLVFLFEINSSLVQILPQ